jgi:uncharacterized membrane-anchored protein
MNFNPDKTLRLHAQLLRQANRSPKLTLQDEQITTEYESKKPIPVCRLWLPLLIQTAIILAIPAQPLYTRLTGKTVILQQTAPVDPYHPLRGYSITLSYDISRVDSLQNLPGWAELLEQHPSSNVSSSASRLAQGTNFYVILEQPKSSTSGIPQAWKPVRVSAKLPASVAANQVALKGQYTHGTIKYGLETYYIPEEQQEQINYDISQSRQSRQNQSILVEIKVDARGHAVPIGFSVWDVKARTSLRNYHF